MAVPWVHLADVVTHTTSTNKKLCEFTTRGLPSFFFYGDVPVYDGSPAQCSNISGRVGHNFLLGLE